jgi:hypothetical protein
MFRLAVILVTAPPETTKNVSVPFTSKLDPAATVVIVAAALAVKVGADAIVPVAK